MGMIGKSRAYDPYTAVQDEPSLGARALNFVGENLLGVNVLGIQRRKAAEQAQQQFLADLTGRLQGAPAGQAPAPVGNDQGGDISAAFAPQMEATPAKAPLDINSPEMATIALRAQQLGVPISNVMDVLKAQQPDMFAASDGTMHNKHDAGLNGQRFANPTVVNGRIVDVNEPGNLNQAVPQQAPFGWRLNPDGTASPIPGGPADPSYISRTAGVRRDAVVSRPMPSRAKAVHPNAIKWD